VGAIIPRLQERAASRRSVNIQYEDGNQVRPKARYSHIWFNENTLSFQIYHIIDHGDITLAYVLPFLNDLDLHFVCPKIDVAPYIGKMAEGESRGGAKGGIKKTITF
jgi:hypothetical protein